MVKRIEKAQEIDDFSYHEVVDRCYLTMCMIQDNIINHQAMKHHPDQAEILQNVIASIWEVYKNFYSAERKENGK